MSAPPARARLEELGLPGNCAEVLRHLWDHLDGKVTAETSARLTRHLESCRDCREYGSFQTCFLEALARLRTELEAPDSVRERVAAALEREGCGCWDRVRRRAQG